MVVFGSFLVQILLMGVAGSLGVVFSEWADEFGVSIGTASTVIAIVPLLVGLLSKYIHRELNKLDL